MDNHYVTITKYLQKIKDIVALELIFNEFISMYNIRNTSEKYML